MRLLPSLGAAAPHLLQMAPVPARAQTKRTILSRIDSPCTMGTPSATCIAKLEVVAACRRSVTILTILRHGNGAAVITHKSGTCSRYYYCNQSEFQLATLEENQLGKISRQFRSLSGVSWTAAPAAMVPCTQLFMLKGGESRCSVPDVHTSVRNTYALRWSVIAL